MGRYMYYETSRKSVHIRYQILYLALFLAIHPRFWADISIPKRDLQMRWMSIKWSLRYLLFGYTRHLSKQLTISLSFSRIFLVTSQESRLLSAPAFISLDLSMYGFLSSIDSSFHFLAASLFFSLSELYFLASNTHKQIVLNRFCIF